MVNLDTSPGVLEHEVFKAMMIYNNFAKLLRLNSLLQQNPNPDIALEALVAGRAIDRTKATKIQQGYKQKLADIQSSKRAIEHELLKSMVVINHLANYEDVKRLLRETPDVDETIARMIAKRMITEDAGIELLALYHRKLDEILAPPPAPKATAAPAGNGQNGAPQRVSVKVRRGLDHLKHDMLHEIDIFHFIDRQLSDGVVIEAIQEALIDVAKRRHPPRFILSFEKVNAGSAQLLGMLMAVKQGVGGLGGKVALCDIGRSLDETFRFIKKDKLPPIYEDFDKAVKKV